VPRFSSAKSPACFSRVGISYMPISAKGTDAQVLHRQLQESGLELISCEDISANVVRGMQLNTQKYMSLINQLVPALLRKPAMRFAGVPGSEQSLYEELKFRPKPSICRLRFRANRANRDVRSQFRYKCPPYVIGSWNCRVAERRQEHHF